MPSTEHLHPTIPILVFMHDYLCMIMISPYEILISMRGQRIQEYEEKKINSIPLHNPMYDEDEKTFISKDKTI